VVTAYIQPWRESIESIERERETHLLIVGYRENHCVQKLHLFHIVGGDFTQLNFLSGVAREKTKSVSIEVYTLSMPRVPALTYLPGIVAEDLCSLAIDLSFGQCLR
jgi:hypothetical protein